ncbi:MAG: NADH-quinone oxidoreductase subunit NuoH [Deltaproteobacteria bacterium]|nr:NADH-quinone oxidoreductase subunit NuoH [Deltaproteobacteria bacterium]
MLDSALILELAIMFIKVFVVGSVLFALPIPLTWLERKVAGHIQVRLGPFRVGPHGVLQPLADMIKMLLKEDIVPEKADKWLFRLAPIMTLVPTFTVFVAIPFGDKVRIPFTGREVALYISDMNVAVLYILAISGLGIYGIIFGGWASNSKYALLGGLRSAAQMISYEVAMSFAVIGVVMLSNSLSLVEIVKSQSGGFLHWNFFYLPVGPLWFIIFIIAGFAETNRIPFDMPEDEGSLGAGYHVEYSGMRFAYYMLAEYVAMVTVSVLAVIFFFGGWNPPFNLPFHLTGETAMFVNGGWNAEFLNLLAAVIPLFWFAGKVAVFIYSFMWIRFTLPRYRYDQLMRIGWRVLIPLSMVNILVTGFMRI